MLITDREGLPISILVESAQKAESKLGISVIDSLGKDKRKVEKIIADRAYDTRKFRKAMYNRGIKPVIPKQRRGFQKSVRQMKSVKREYRNRWVVERTFAWIQNFRRLVVRWDRLESTYRGFLLFACIVVCMGRLLK